MNPRLVLKKDDTILSSYNISRGFSSKIYAEKINNFQFDVLEGEEREISLDGVRIFFGNLKIDNPLVFEARSNFPFLSISFEIGGDSFYVPKGNCTKSTPMSIKKNGYNFFYMPQINGTAKIKGEYRKYFIIIFTEEYIKHVFKGRFSEVDFEFEKALINKTPYVMFKESRTIPFSLLKLINEIKDCYYNNNIKEIYIKSKIMEMFALIFSELDKHNKVKKLKKRDLEIIQKSEEIIKNNLSVHITLEQLSQKAGTNQSKLKELFGLVYNETVFGFSSRLRMEKAKKLLMADNTIHEVSCAVGYKNPQHFSTAFKKRFGYLPSVFKRKFDYVNA